MLENLRAIKAKHRALCSQVKEIAAAQKESMDSIRNNLSSVMQLIQHFQQTTDVEVPTQTVNSLFKHHFMYSYCIQRRVLRSVCLHSTHSPAYYMLYAVYTWCHKRKQNVPRSITDSLSQYMGLLDFVINVVAYKIIPQPESVDKWRSEGSI